MWWTLLVPGLVVCLVGLFLFRRSRYYRLASRLPSAQSSSPLGHVYELWLEKDELLSKMVSLVEETRNALLLSSQGLLALWYGPHVVVLIDNLPDIQRVMTSKTLITKAYQYKFLEPWLGKGLITATGSHWYNHRKLITPAFHFSILEKFIPVFNSNIEIYLKKLDEHVGKGSFNIEKYVCCLCLDIIAETAMSAKINAQIEESEYTRRVKELTETILLRCFRLLYYPDFIFNFTKLGARQKENGIYIEKFIRKLVQEKRRERDQTHPSKPQILEEDGKKSKVALLDLLLETQSEGSETPLSDKDILDEVNTFMFGGHDTLTSGINFTLYFLSKNPDIQREVAKEIEEVAGDSEEGLSYRQLGQLKLLERVIKETLRILPVVPVVVRAVSQELTLESGHTIPAGCSIILFIYKMHRNPDIFPDPEKFDPDRFLPENCAKRHPYAYMPFSAGPRNCIGQKFAMIEMKAVIAATIRRYEVLPSVGQEIKPTLQIVLKSANGVHLALRRRRRAVRQPSPRQSPKTRTES